MRPVAFRIFDFKSIEDSGICQLSGDRITALAGQNEAGKTATLKALRDFDRDVGSPPATKDYRPEERPDAVPRVSVQFAEIDFQHLLDELRNENLFLPLQVTTYFGHVQTLWITRTLDDGLFSFEEDFAAQWPKDETELTIPAVVDSEGKESQPGKKLISANDFAGWVRGYWPQFVYFEAFQDSLPREVDFDAVQAAVAEEKAESSTSSNKSKISSSVLDFILMADLDIDRVAALASNDKSLGNYLNQRGTSVTGDFLEYWKQRVDGDQTVDLLVRHHRDEKGNLRLAFYVHDKSDQYPDQRSKGFLWFLSFYLKLAAAQKRYPDRRQLLLIDEPGSYLHARAQRDVLHLLEHRIAASDQVIYSTHSPFLLPSDRLHRLRIVLKKATTGTRILDRLTHPDIRGEEFADSLSPVIAAIGIDISQAITFKRQKNLFVEGISDYMYLTSWARKFSPKLIEEFNIFPGTGATTIPALASLFIGWGFKFIALLDNDDQGKNACKKLVDELSVPEERIVRPKEAKTIEDVFSHDDFRSLLTSVDASLTLNPGERASQAIARQNVDKVLLARSYSEQADQAALTKKSEEAIKRLLADLRDAWDK